MTKVTLDELSKKILSYNTNADIQLLNKVYEFAVRAHEGQLRSSGEPYITHPLEVAYILAELGLDLPTISAGLLHDVVEDTEYTLETVEAMFGSEIAHLVNGVTKLGRIEYRSKEEQQVENLRKMFFAMAHDIRVILIKLADRLHNMRTLKHLPEAKQKEISEETMEIYAPLAHRLGIYKIKWELEDLSLRYQDQKAYYEMVDKIAMKRDEREAYISNVVGILIDKLSDVGIKAEIDGRPKHFYSIYKKMLEQNKDIDEIYDLIAVRVTVETIRDCYGALGIVHTLWKPIPGRFKDYIAMPKSNMYQSLHTTVVGPEGEPFEIQIRTWDMHRTAEYGIAAHWRYKEGAKSDNDFDQKLSWLRQLLEWQSDLGDAREFMETLKIDVFSDAVFVFSPKGDVYELPSGSNPIDFAYRVHTNVGHRCVGAKINGKIVTLDYKLRNGDIVEIITTKQPNGPSRDWLKIVKTSQAKNKIRGWFKKEKRDENIVKGKENLEKETKKLALEPAELLKADKLLEIAKRFNLFTLEDLYAALGDGAITYQQILSRLKDDIKKDKPLTVEDIRSTIQPENKKPARRSKENHGVRVKGEDDVMVRLARCCNPVPGDPIIGYITRGRGVSVHRQDCGNVINHQLGEEERMIEVSWDDRPEGAYHVKLEVTASDRAGLLNDVMLILSELRISAEWVSARGNKDKTAAIDLELELKNKEQLEIIIHRIKKVKGVYDVWRVTPKT